MQSRHWPEMGLITSGQAQRAKQARAGQRPHGTTTRRARPLPGQGLHCCIPRARAALQHSQGKGCIAAFPGQGLRTCRMEYTFRPCCGMASTHGRLAIERRSSSLEGGHGGRGTRRGWDGLAVLDRGMVHVQVECVHAAAANEGRLLSRQAGVQAAGSPAVLARLAGVTEQHGAARRAVQQRVHGGQRRFLHPDAAEAG